MQEFQEEEQSLWLIPGKNLEDRGLNDGDAKCYQVELGGNDHRTCAANFCKKYGFDETFCITYENFGEYFTDYGIAVVINIGKINGKSALGGIYLPANLTEKQIDFFMNRKELFQEKFHENFSYFEPRVRPEGDLPYKTFDGFRDLRIESIIEGKRTDNGQELLFRELERQKEALKEHENKI